MSLSARVERALQDGLANKAAGSEILAAINNATNGNLASGGNMAGTFTLAANTAFVSNTTNGTQWGTAANQKQGWFGVNPVIQPATAGVITGTSGNGATNANAANFASNGNLGNTAMTQGDIVACLKKLGFAPL